MLIYNVVSVTEAKAKQKQNKQETGLTLSFADSI